MNKAVIPKGILLVLAIITAGVGLYSHYSSDWSGVDRDYFKGLTGDNAPYHICDDWYPKDGCTVIPLDLCDLFALIPGFPSVGCKIEFDTCNRCPKIALERFFVGASIICAIGALASLGLSFASKSKGLKFADIGLNVVLGLLIVVASALYIISAVQIHKILEPFQTILDTLKDLADSLGVDIDAGIRERYGAKIAAAAVGFLQALFHCAVAVTAARG